MCIEDSVYLYSEVPLNNFTSAARARARKCLADKQAAAVPIGRNNKGQPIYRRQRTGFVSNQLLSSI
jgi:hypothetical protein